MQAHNVPVPNPTHPPIMTPKPAASWQAYTHPIWLLTNGWITNIRTNSMVQKLLSHSTLYRLLYWLWIYWTRRSFISNWNCQKNTTPRLLTLASTMQEAALSKTTIPSFTWEYASYLQNALQKFFFSLPSHTNIGQVYHQSWWKPTSMKYSLVYSLENLLHCWRSRNLPWITIICFTNRPKTHIQVLQTKVFCGSEYFQKPIQMSK